MAIGRTNAGGGGGIKGLPEFTYTGTYEMLDDGDKNWRLKLLTSGTLTFTKLGTGNGTVDVFCVGGGGGGSVSEEYGKGGGGGYTKTYTGAVLLPNQSYVVTVGAGGENGVNGGDSAIGTMFAAGGRKGNSGPDTYGGNGGSGGGGNGGVGGSDGGNGGGSQAGGGTGQGTTTREFGETTGDLYAGGGGSHGSVGGAGGGGASRENGVVNSGGGGGMHASGGSGIVILRNHRAA